MKAVLRRLAKALSMPFTWYFTKWFVDIVTRLDGLAARMTRVEDSVVQEVETASELVLVTRRELTRLNDRLAALEAAIAALRARPGG